MKRTVILTALMMMGSLSPAKGDEPPKPAAANAAAAASPCSSKEHDAFDYWVGDWDVANAAGVLAANSHIERILDGCVVMENYTQLRGGYQGKSFNTYDPATGQWTQHYVDNGGLTSTMVGTVQGGNLVFMRQFRRKDGVDITTRMTFFNLATGKVRQFVEQSKDGGKTWVPNIDLTYTRRKK